MHIVTAKNAIDTESMTACTIHAEFDVDIFWTRLRSVVLFSSLQSHFSFSLASSRLVIDCSSSRGRDLYACDMADEEGNKCITKKRTKSTPGASREKEKKATSGQGRENYVWNGDVENIETKEVSDRHAA